MKPIFYFVSPRFLRLPVVSRFGSGFERVRAFGCGRLESSAYFFAFVPTRVDVAFAGRAFAAYGGIYVVASLAWLYPVERQIPNNWDLIGVATCSIGTVLILLGAREAK